jgi:hypothetical protein
MQRSVWVLALALAVAACGAENNVVVRASLDQAGAQPVPDLPVHLLPYDRAAILDSLAAEGDSLPEIPAGASDSLRSLQAEANRVKPRGDSAVARVEARRTALVARLDSVRKAREQWLEDHRKDFEKAAERAAGGQAEQSDTTDSAGRAAFGAEPGRWWVTASYVLPDRVLEWSVPITARKDSMVVRLRPSNAKERPFY